MQMEYQRDLNNHYLILTGGQALAEEAYQIRMLCENRLQGFTDCHVERIDEAVRYCYQVTSMQNLQELTEIRPADLRLLRALLTSLSDAIQEADTYLLPQDGIVLLPEYIFSDVSRERFFFCYYPEHTVPIAEGMHVLSEYLLPRLDEADREAVMLGFSFYQMCAAGDMTEQRLRELLYRRGWKQMDGADETTASGASVSDRSPYIVSGESPYTVSGGPLHAAYDGGAGLTDGGGAARDPEQQAREQERARILDDFFSDDADIEEARVEAAHRRMLWFAAAGLAAVGTAALCAVSGMVQTGLGLAVLILAAAILLWRRRDQIRAFRNAHTIRFGKREQESEGLTDQVGLDWRTYDERAAELLERSDGADIPFVNPYADPVWPAGNFEAMSEERPAGAAAVKSAATPAEISAVRPEAMKSGEQPADALPATGTSETVWLGDTPYETRSIRARLTGCGGTEPAELLLSRETHLIGKNSAAADLVLDSDAVSRLHARLQLQDQEYVLTDLRSKNGTVLNRTLLDAGRAYPLKSGDVVRFADLTFRYETFT